MIRVLLVDDQAILCQALQTWLERESDLEVVGSAHDGETAIEQVEVLKPDVVLLDIQMPGMDGIAATQILSERFGDTKVIVLSGYDNDSYLGNALRAGAKGYLLKNTAAEDLANTIRSVHKGYSQVGPGLFDKIMARVGTEEDETDDSSPLPDLSKLSLSEPEFQTLVEGFDAPALSKIIDRAGEQEALEELLARLSRYLRGNPNNIAALYLAGASSRRMKDRTLSAFQYLKFGFKEGVKRGLSREELLLFYREAVTLKTDEAFSWLCSVESPWNCPQGFPFLLQEADRLFGRESVSYQTLLTLSKIETMRVLSDEYTVLGTKLESLQHGFERLGQMLKL
ncbi:response regulator transcription factor [Oscillatoriales cyanobacterium LEGE 11467]|uniref:Response regulator transcription factor n=1 Tax=Zarconia navalis LEGE 11467 TaxID=1828826 RepID=A0A928VY21_9CYAN|nr:response regulator transcription factor [Zarconia navalis]MBE9040877.1 response regulator transcription factor [Zarconia navalis LEGE 11467]